MIYIDPPYGIKFGSTGRSPPASATSRTARSRTPPARSSRSRPSATPGNWVSTPTSPTCATACRRPRSAHRFRQFFVQIGDENVHLVRCLLDEVFGSENFCPQLLSRRHKCHRRPLGWCQRLHCLVCDEQIELSIAAQYRLKELDRSWRHAIYVRGRARRKRRPLRVKNWAERLMVAIVPA